MPVLRINQEPGGAPNQYRIEVTASGIPGLAAQSFSKDITFGLTPQDSEGIRWYLEDYLQFDEEPAPQIAQGVEAFMRESGEALFRSIFEGSPPAIQLWELVEAHLQSTRIEIATGITDAAAILWELIRNPHTGTFLALSAQSFVRTQRAPQTARTLASEAAKVRILLVICRPGGDEDVPFRAVAGRLVTRLSDDAFDIDVLRPPTWEQLAKTLERARDDRQPYHIVHFDGHGIYSDAESLPREGKVLSGPMLKSESTRRRAFLVFENPASTANREFVDGPRLGALLRDTGVPVLVLNAGQSAFAEAPGKPEGTITEARDEFEAYGSLAQAVVGAGAAGVVAMRYAVYVATAAQFVAELYGALARGRGLGEAVTAARKNLHDRPNRRIAYDARPLQDWSVPVVWEREPLRLWPEQGGAAASRILVEEGAAANPGALDSALPLVPDIGFFGRDETIYALDRAFDKHRIVLLHAHAGSGKTSTAAEFARWYALTGGVEGPVLFSSFERHLPLARVLDKIGVVFGAALEAGGVQWDATTDPATRHHIALQVLQQVPVLWIWDNVEPVTGFPAGTPSDWSAAEQQELRAFLAAARETKAKFLLTSRRDEQPWLGDLARRVQLPPMPMQERLQLAGAVAAQRGRRLAELPDLTSLLRFTRGNPLTILVTVGEALRRDIDTAAGLDAFVTALHGDAVHFEDEASERHSKSSAPDRRHPVVPTSSTTFGEDFPGNSHVRERLLANLRAEKATAFVGAGASMELYKGWGDLLTFLSQEAKRRALANDDDVEFWNLQQATRPQQVARMIRQKFEDADFFSVLKNYFGDKKSQDTGKFYTQTHQLIVNLPFKGIITTNYDPGLWNALRNNRPDASSPLSTWQDKQAVIDWHTKDVFQDSEKCPILHIHGAWLDPSTIVLDNNKYREVYGLDYFKTMIKSLWSQERLVLIGCGFTDTWLDRNLDEILGQAGSGISTRHTALIGIKEEHMKHVPRYRSLMQNMYRIDVIFYPIRAIVENGERRSDHSGLLSILNEIHLEIKKSETGSQRQ